MESQYKKFHFQEVDCLIYFSPNGNSGKYCNYNVVLVDRKTGKAQPEKVVKLGDFLDSPEIEQKYPHTIGYFKVSSGEKENFKPEYLELRVIRTVEEFWLFLNALDI